MFRVPKEHLRLLSSQKGLTLYQWGTLTGEDYFCSKCGILPFRKPSALTQEEIAKGMKPFDGWAVNARCLVGFDFLKIPIIPINGSAIHLS